MASRLNIIICSIISLTQSTFILGRNMLDMVPVANELIDEAVKKSKNYMLLKVDFEKMYDIVSWNYLRFLLKKFGFGVKWFKWLEAYVFSSHLSILVNGSPTE